MDFTFREYRRMLTALIGAGYEFHPVKDLFSDAGKGERCLYLRHDVDKKPGNSLLAARMEAELGIRATYYFRAVPCSWDEDVIRETAALGHEVGYHYESLATCSGDIDAAYLDFSDNLSRLRKLAEVVTVCMHGSPRFREDSRDIWDRYDYRELGIIGEPYLDTDWSKMFYLTDTGRRWDGYKVSVRDKVARWQDIWIGKGLSFRHTREIIGRAESLPDSIMMTTHPQRWNDALLPWLGEFVWQNVKNIVKRAIVSRDFVYLRDSSKNTSGTL